MIWGGVSLSNDDAGYWGFIGWLVAALDDYGYAILVKSYFTCNKFSAGQGIRIQGLRCLQYWCCSLVSGGWDDVAGVVGCSSRCHLHL